MTKLYLHHGHLYRALRVHATRSETRRQQQLQAAKAADYLPDWEELWEYLQEEPEAQQIYRHYVLQNPDCEPDAVDKKEGEPGFCEEAWEEVYQDGLTNYDRIELLLSGELNGYDCWRAVRLSRGVDPQEHSDLGIYWSRVYSGAQTYDAYGRGANVVYRARIDVDYINKYETARLNTHWIYGDTEKEVRFYPGAPIFVYDVQLEDGTVELINDWRRC